MSLSSVYSVARAAAIMSKRNLQRLGTSQASALDDVTTSRVTTTEAMRDWAIQERNATVSNILSSGDEDRIERAQCQSCAIEIQSVICQLYQAAAGTVFASITVRI